VFPNPQAALPLTKNPTVKKYQNLAQQLLRAARAFNAGDEAAITKWTEKWVEPLELSKVTTKDAKRLQRMIDRKVDEVETFVTQTLVSKNSKRTLSRARYAIASVHGFKSWATFVKHLTALSQNSSTIARFEKAADAIVDGDLKTLKRLLKQEPKLVRTSSTREHHAKLLHYVSANGVEGYRQKTPSNIVAITKALLDAGANVNAEAVVYGGSATTLGLVATSSPPRNAGVQNELLRLLIDYGANIDHPTAAGRSSAVNGCLANGCFNAAAYLANNGAALNLEAAAGVGRLDLVEKFFNASGVRKNVKRKELVSGFLYACAWGQTNVVRFMLEHGVSPAVHRGDGQSGPHWAAIAGQLEILKLLLKFEAPLESKNMYGGTVLGQTLWSAAHGGDPKVYSEFIETLIAAGAKLNDRHVPVNKTIDDLLRKYGSVPEPTWYWYGEKPRK